MGTTVPRPTLAFRLRAAVGRGLLWFIWAAEAPKRATEARLAELVRQASSSLRDDLLRRSRPDLRRSPETPPRGFPN